MVFLGSDPGFAKRGNFALVVSLWQRPKCNKTSKRSARKMARPLERKVATSRWDVAQRRSPLPRPVVPTAPPPAPSRKGSECGRTAFLYGRGRLFYISHFKGGAGAPPLKPLRSGPELSMPPGVQGGLVPGGAQDPSRQARRGWAPPLLQARPWGGVAIAFRSFP